MLRLYPESFEWKQPPYEYEVDRMPIDLLIGDKNLRSQLEKSQSIAFLEASWQSGLEEFKTISREYHLY
jgi:uncharacterized protein YbbC (DUF1343 family)